MNKELSNQIIVSLFALFSLMFVISDAVADDLTFEQITEQISNQDKYYHDLKITIIPPTTDVDGEELKPGEIFAYVLCLSYEPFSSTCVNLDVVSADETNIVIKNRLPEGVPIFVRAKTVTIYGNQSVWSDPVGQVAKEGGAVTIVDNDHSCTL